MLPKYWDDTFLVATYLINRTPTKLLSYSTPLQKLLGASCLYKFLRIWLCLLAQLRPYNTHKLQLQSTRCVFLGYSNMHKGLSALIRHKGAYTFPGMSSLMSLYL
jgi:hypothetical protein